MLAQILSTWIVAPLVFLFLLSDTGEIKRGLLSLVPNRLFEPALTVLADLDHALGDWVRGLFLECSLLGITVAVLLAIIGIPLRWSIAMACSLARQRCALPGASRCWTDWPMPSWHVTFTRCFR